MVDYLRLHVQFSRRLNVWCKENGYQMGGPEHLFAWSLYEAWERARIKQAA